MTPTELKEFPKKFRDIIGTHNEYRCKGKQIRGIVDQIRWSSAFIMNMKTEKEYYGIELRFKPDDGSKAVWTKAFNSKISIKNK